MSKFMKHDLLVAHKNSTSTTSVVRYLWSRNSEHQDPWIRIYVSLEVQLAKQRMVFRMIHIKDSRSYQWAKFGRLGLPGIYVHIQVD